MRSHLRHNENALKD